MIAYLKAFIHNCVVHPLMMLLPPDQATLLHDKNVGWAYGEVPYDKIAIESTLWVNKLSTTQLLNLKEAIDTRLSQLDKEILS